MSGFTWVIEGKPSENLCNMIIYALVRMEKRAVQWC